MRDRPARATLNRMNELESIQPRRYRIVVRGGLGECAVAGAFEHLVLERRAGESSLTGTFADQAQLHGLLGRLRDLGIPLVSVNPID